MGYARTTNRWRRMRSALGAAVAALALLGAGTAPSALAGESGSAATSAATLPGSAAIVAGTCDRFDPVPLWGLDAVAATADDDDERTAPAGLSVTTLPVEPGALLATDAAVVVSDDGLVRLCGEIGGAPAEPESETGSRTLGLRSFGGSGLTGFGVLDQDDDGRATVTLFVAGALGDDDGGTTGADSPAGDDDGRDPAVGGVAGVFAGDCDDDPSSAPAFSLNGLGAGDDDGVGNSYTAVALPLDRAVTGAYAIRVRDDDGGLLCGPIAGIPAADGSLIVGLREDDDSGATGIAFLAPATTDDGPGMGLSLFVGQGLANFSDDDDDTGVAVVQDVPSSGVADDGASDDDGFDDAAASEVSGGGDDGSGGVGSGGAAGSDDDGGNDDGDD